ncbi:MAG: aminotransferase class III-fold pyridoxal phosphate-dependent enzyme, partial [Gaiellales bacterium]
MSDSTFEFPGFHMPDTPVFNGALGTSMFSGPALDPKAVLDLGMVFGSRLWGHDIPTLDATELGAPGVGDLFTHDARERATAALCEQGALEMGLAGGANALRALVLHTGSEAVETALKTALRATGRERIVAFEGGYHGTFGLALAVTSGVQFRAPWAAQYSQSVAWAPWGEVPHLDEEVACVIVEPWQGRAGVIAPPEGFLAGLRVECDRVGAVLIVDAVMCGA